MLSDTDHCRAGGDVKEREGVGGGKEETGADPAAAVQVPADRTEGGRELNKRTLQYLNLFNSKGQYTCN